MIEFSYDENYVPISCEEIICSGNKVFKAEIAEELIKLGQKATEKDGVFTFKHWQTEKFDDDYEAVFSAWWDFDIKRNRAYYKEHPWKPMFGRGSK